MGSKIGGGGGPASAVKSASTTVNVSAATAPSSGQVLTATSSTTATWQTPAGGGVGGSTGAADNAILRSDGTGGATLQATGIIVDDSNRVSGGLMQTSSEATPATALSGTFFYTDIGDGPLTFTLPASPVIGTWFDFNVVSAGDGVVVKASGSQVIRAGASVSTAGGTFTSSTLGSYLSIVYVKANLWSVRSLVGTWAAA